jgi:5-methylcytosine-specific restriction enzyme subunit McrC
MAAGYQMETPGCRRRDNKYDLAQQDFYQMLAYGHKYLESKGEMVLIYPKTREFPAH